MSERIPFTAPADTVMNAAVYRRFGGPDVVRVTSMPKPVPARGEVRVRVTASVVTAADAAMRSGRPFAARLFAGPFHPRLPVMGSDFTGVVDALGEGADRFRIGDRVWGVTGAAMRAHAEFAVVGADGILEPMPEELDAVLAAALVDATALSFLDDTAQLRRGQTILINGASGTVGAIAVQLAVARGAIVTAVCSAQRAGLVRDLGAHEVLDYRAADVVAALAASGRTFDVVFDVIGSMGYRRARGILTGSGRYCATVPTLPILWHTLWTGRSKGKRGVIAFTGLRRRAAVLSDLQETAELARSGVVKPIVDTVYPLGEIAAAHAHVERGKAGSIVVSMARVPQERAATADWRA